MESRQILERKKQRQILVRKNHIEKMWQLQFKCRKIYEGIDLDRYHDWMVCQLDAMREHIQEAEVIELEYFESYLKDVEDTYKWFQHVEKISELETSMPESIFG